MTVFPEAAGLFQVLGQPGLHRDARLAQGYIVQPCLKIQTQSLRDLFYHRCPFRFDLHLGETSRIFLVWVPPPRKWQGNRGWED